MSFLWMNAEEKMDRGLPSDELTDNQHLALLFAAGAGIITTFGAGIAAYGSWLDSEVHAAADRYETIADQTRVVHGARAGGIAAGLEMGGTIVPGAMMDRIAAIVGDEVAADAAALADQRAQGMEDAMSGGWSTERLDTYLDRIEQIEPRITGMLEAGAAELEDAGVSGDVAMREARLAAVLAMTFTETYKPGEKVVEAIGRASDEAFPSSDLVDGTQALMWSMRARIDDLEDAGGLHDHALRDLARERAIALTTAPEADSAPDISSS